MNHLEVDRARQATAMRRKLRDRVFQHAIARLHDSAKHHRIALALGYGASVHRAYKQGIEHGWITL